MIKAKYCKQWFGKQIIENRLTDYIKKLHIYMEQSVNKTFKKKKKKSSTYKWPQNEANDWSQSDKLRPSSFSFSRPTSAKRSITTYSRISYSSCVKNTYSM